MMNKQSHKLFNAIDPSKFIRLIPVGSAHFRTLAEIKKEEAFRKKTMLELDRKGDKDK